LPFSKISPFDGKIFAIVFSKVVFPQPFGPTMEMLFSICRLIFFMTSTPPYPADTSLSVSMTGASLYQLGDNRVIVFRLMRQGTAYTSFYAPSGVLEIAAAFIAQGKQWAKAC